MSSAKKDESPAKIKEHHEEHHEEAEWHQKGEDPSSKTTWHKVMKIQKKTEKTSKTEEHTKTYRVVTNQGGKTISSSDDAGQDEIKTGRETTTTAKDAPATTVETTEEEKKDEQQDDLVSTSSKKEEEDQPKAAKNCLLCQCCPKSCVLQ
jgi:hypothetical protein